MTRRTAPVLALACAAGLAHADITETGEFFGDAFETFENVATPGAHPGPLNVFGGGATLDDSVAHTIVIAFNFTGASGTVLPLGGNLFGATLAGAAVYDFDTELYRFGGYVNTVGVLGGGTAVFKDDEGNVIDTVSFSSNPIEWTWIGWESDTAFTTVELSGANGIGQGLLFDNMHAGYFPTPGAAGALAMGLGVLARRRTR